MTNYYELPDGALISTPFKQSHLRELDEGEFLRRSHGARELHEQLEDQIASAIEAEGRERAKAREAVAKKLGLTLEELSAI